MTEPDPRHDIEVHPVLIPVAVRDHEIVGAKLRPDRALTVGKRRSDRWMAYAMAGALVVLSFFAAFASVRMYFVGEDVQIVLERCLP